MVFRHISVILLYFQPYHLLKWHFKGENDEKNDENDDDDDNDDDTKRHWNSDDFQMTIWALALITPPFGARMCARPWDFVLHSIGWTITIINFILSHEIFSQ